MWPSHARPGAPAPRILPPLETLVLVLHRTWGQGHGEPGVLWPCTDFLPPEATSWSHRAAGGRGSHWGRLCEARGGAGPGTCCFLFHFSTCVDCLGV